MLLLAACSSGGADDGAAQEASSDTSDQGSDEATALSITVVDESALPDWQPPPWEAFDVELAPVTIREQITAVGESDSGTTPLGSSCDQLLADFPELTGCEEFVDEYPEAGTYVDIGQLSADGMLTIDSPEVASELRIEATDPQDELCSWFGIESIEPGQSTVVVPVALACA